MVDVMVASTFGYRLGALAKWAMGIEVPLSTAINDFPKRGILVNPSFKYCLYRGIDIFRSGASSLGGLGISFVVFPISGGDKCVIRIAFLRM